MQILLFVSPCLHLGMAKVWTSSFLINSLQYKSAHLWPSAKQLYQRPSAERVMTWLPSLVLSQLNKGQSTVLSQALLRNYIVKNSKFWITITWKARSEPTNRIAEKPSFTIFFTVPSSVCRWDPGAGDLHWREKKAFGQADRPVSFSIAPWNWIQFP